MQVDKKTQGGELRFIVLSKIGVARFKTVPSDALLQVLALAEAGTDSVTASV